MAQNNKVLVISCWNDNSAWIQRPRTPKRIYKNLTHATQIRLEQFAWNPAYQITVNLLAGLAVFIRPNRS